MRRFPQSKPGRARQGADAGDSDRGTGTGACPYDPPLPPLNRGARKSKTPLPGEGISPFLPLPVKGGRGGLLFQQAPHWSKLTRISPQLPSFLKSRTAVSCALRGEAIYPQLMETMPKMRGFSMESNQESGAEAAVSSPYAHGASGGSADRQQGSRAHGCEGAADMKIIIFPAKFDKFTGFFDKFLKGVCLVTDCNHKGYHPNLSVAHSDMATKKVFRLPRICPQLPAFGRALHHAGKPSLPGRVRHIRNASPGL